MATLMAVHATRKPFNILFLFIKWLTLATTCTRDTHGIRITIVAPQDQVSWMGLLVGDKEETIQKTRSKALWDFSRTLWSSSEGTAIVLCFFKCTTWDFYCQQNSIINIIIIIIAVWFVIKLARYDAVMAGNFLFCCRSDGYGCRLCYVARA